VAARLTEEGCVSGVVYVYDKERLIIEMDRPRMITVVGVNTLTGKEKLYILKVTEKGICLV